MNIYAGKADQAYRMGSSDAYLERPPLDVTGADSAVLMDALGEHDATTVASYGPRVTMCDAYLDGYHDTRSALAS